MRLIILSLLLLLPCAVQAGDCPLDSSIVFADAKPLPPERFEGISKKMNFEAIIERLGPPAREVGSGLYVFQWRVTDGRVFFVSIARPCGTPTALGFAPSAKAREDRSRN